MRACIVCGLLVLLLVLAPGLSAQRLVLDVPQRVAGRGIDLRAGDVLERAEGGLDGATLRRLEVEQATRATVRLLRRRGDSVELLELPAGSWDLETLPERDAPRLAELPALRAARDWPRALEALARWTAAQEEPGVRAEGLLLRARWLALAADWPGADAVLEEAIAVAPEQAADFLEAHLRTLDRRVDRRVALALAERLVALRANDGPARQAHALLLRGRARSLLRDNAGAVADATAALALAPDSIDGAQARLLLGFSALRSGQRAEAGAALEQARERIAALAPDSLELAGIVAQQATLAGISGAEDTLPRFDAALARLRVLASDIPLIGTTAMNAHLMAMQRRRFDAAEAYAREALAALRRNAPGTLMEQQARTALADVLLRRAQFAEAESLFVAALAAGEAIDALSYETLSTRLQLGQTMLAQGRHEQAHAVFDTLIARIDDLPADSPVRGTSLDADARVYRMHARNGLGRHDEARADGEYAYARYEALARNETVRAETLTGMAESAWRGGDLGRARAEVEDALARYTQAGAGAIQRAGVHFLRARIRRDGGDIEGALADYEAAIDGLEAHRAVVGGDDDIRARWAAQYQDFYKEPMLLRARRGEADAAAALEQRYRAQLLRRLLADPDGAPAAWRGEHSPGAMLQPDQALISFVSGSEALLAFVWRAGDEQPALTVIALPAQELGARVDRLRLLSARRDAPEGARLAFDAQSLALYRALFDPLQAQTDSATRWTLVADGALRRLPFAALAIEAGDSPRRLVEARSIALAASPAVYAQVPASADAEGAVVGFADVDPAHAPPRDATRYPDLAAPLPGARREVEALVALHGSRARAFLGAEATEAAARAQAPDAAILHFAVHGVLDASEPTRSFLALARGSGAADDDGRLSAAEIATLSLPGTLVVLSSCESALGGDAGGEGLLGMSRALAAAGAGAVLGTLWRVPDTATARLLEAFHRELREGTPPDLALAHAQRNWLARARAAGAWERLLDTLGLAEAPPPDAAQAFHWAGLVLEHRAETR